MTAFLKSIDNKTCKVVVTRRTSQDINYEGQFVNKEQNDWSLVEDDDATLGNYRALNVIFKGVDKSVFILINTFVSVKVAWDVLAVAHEASTVNIEV